MVTDRSNRSARPAGSLDSCRFIMATMRVSTGYDADTPSLSTCTMPSLMQFIRVWTNPRSARLTSSMDTTPPSALARIPLLRVALPVERVVAMSSPPKACSSLQFRGIITGSLP